MIKKILTILITTAALTSCQDTIEPGEERYTPTDEIRGARTVLIEEYTGVECKNCPVGHELLRTIENYCNTPENLAKGAGVIAVGIHIPAYGDAVADGGFVTPEAATLAPNQYVAPTAKVNRNTDVLGTQKWLSAVVSEITQEPKVTFSTVAATVADGKISVSGNVDVLAKLSDPMLHVWIVEDDIIDWQLQPNGEYEEFYKHHAVYRGAVTPLAGQPLADEAFTLTDYTLAPNWVVENLRVVVFVTDGQVLNATQTSINQD